MRKQISKTISILSLSVTFLVGSVKVPAGGSVCSIPSCRPRSIVFETPVVQDAGHDTVGQATPSDVQPESSYSFALFLAQWAIYSLALS